MNSPDGMLSENLRVARKQTDQEKQITFYVNDQPIQACQGETIHAALIAAGYRQFRKSKTDQPRGVFCGMGVCYECLVTIDNGPQRQACSTMVEEGMEVRIDVG